MLSDATNESPSLARFIYEPDWTPVKGAYLFPLKFFGPDRPKNANAYLEIVGIVTVEGTDVAITRGGGVFVRDRFQYDSPEGSDKLLGILNLLLCEFAINGLVSQPMTNLDLSGAKLIGRYISITGGGGSFGERTYAPYALLVSPEIDLGREYGRAENRYWPVPFYWTTHDPDVLNKIDGIPNASRLQKISPTLPSLLVAAQFHSDRHNLAETILSAFIVCEELISYHWDQHVESVNDGVRRERLRDARTYSASVRAEVLFTAARLKQETYDLFQRARKVRNEMAHRSAMNQDAASVCIRAMHAMLHDISVPTSSLPGFTYSYDGGGPGRPRTAVEPEFRFH